MKIKIQVQCHSITIQSKDPQFERNVQQEKRELCMNYEVMFNYTNFTTTTVSTVFGYRSIRAHTNSDKKPTESQVLSSYLTNE